jgi:hypothetical protein
MTKPGPVERAVVGLIFFTLCILGAAGLAGVLLPPGLKGLALPIGAIPSVFTCGLVWSIARRGASGWRMLPWLTPAAALWGLYFWVLLRG